MGILLKKEILNMRIIFILTISGLLFVGCSSIYTVKNFSSKEELYKDFNKSAKTNKIKITLISDSTFITRKGAYISNDSLFFISQIKKVKIKINPADIKKIKYYENNRLSLSADVLLKNGKELKSDSVTLYSDLLYITISKPVHSSISLTLIKNISYKNRLLGIVPGLLIGTGTGFVLAATIYSLLSKGTQSSDNRAGYIALVVLPVSIITGILWGWISGYNYIYQFNL